MQNCDDQELLRLCGTKRSDEAFSEAFSILVSRHLDFVYSSALRQFRDPHLAKDVAQSVFLLLAKKSRTLHHDTILTGWLYRTTRFVVSDTLRDEGLKHSPSYAGVRSSFLLNDLKNLAKVYPPAREALLARRDTAEQTLINTSPDLAAVFQYHQLNEHLDQPARALELFDQLPVGHRARAAMVDVALEQFLTARRYHDILEAGNPEATFDRAKGAFSSVAENSPGREDLQEIIRRRAVENGASALEALAGAGQVDRAIALANSVLDFDSSPETRGQLLKHAQRANHPQVLAHLQSPPPR